MTAYLQRHLRGRAGLSLGAVLAATAFAAVAAGQAAVADPAPPGTYTVVDLGTLGGARSAATAIDGKTVVGTSATPGDGATHAFSYSLRTHRMTDLGTLGGADSSAVAVRGPYVAGVSDLPGGAGHGFVYDLRTHRMTDLGTLGGTGSTATAISGRYVLGVAATPGDLATHAFTYDLVTHRTRDLGSLAGPAGSSTAAGISGGHLVVGDSTVAGEPATVTHGYTYDLRTGHRTDIGTLGGSSSLVTSVSGRIAVGRSRTAGDAGPPSGYAYDLSTGSYTELGRGMFLSPLVSGHYVVAGDSLLTSIEDLRTGTRSEVGPGSGVTEAKDIGHGLVVGDVFTPNSFAFVYRIDTAAFTRLPALGGLNSAAVQSDRHGVVAGSAALPGPDPGTANGPFHAVVWLPPAA
jgi:probable HAF family extracellular repeat protein